MDIENRYAKDGFRIPYRKRDVINYISAEMRIPVTAIERQTDRLFKYQVGDLICWRLWDTDIIVWDTKLETVTLDTGGFKGPFTKNTMNKILRENMYASLGIFQHKFVWYVNTRDGDVEFEDGMILMIGDTH